MDTLRRLYVLLRPHRGSLAAAFGCALITCLGALALPLAVRAVLVTAGTTGSLRVPPQGWVALGLGIVLLAAGSYGALVLFYEVAQRVAGTFRRQCLDHLLAVPVPAQHGQQGGDLLDRLAVSIADVEEFLRHNLLDLTTISVLLVGSPVMMLALSWQLTVVAGLVAVAAGLVLLVVSRRLHRADRAQAAAGGQLTALFQELLLGAEVVQAFTMQASARARFAARQEQLQREQRRVARYVVLLEPMLVVFATVAFVMLLLFGNRWLAAGGLTVERLVTFLAYVAIAATQGRPLSQQVLRWHQLASALHRLDEILSLPRETDPPGARPLSQPVRGEILFQGVAYGYPGRPHAVRNLSFRIAPGECVGIVGESGAGKTTLCNLLLRFVHPQAGTVQVDGVDLESVSYASLRAAIALVPQDSYLFHVSVRENVRYGRPTATEAEVRTACERAQATAFLKALPDGDRTVVGERGLQLSTGQRQRLAIARALLKDAPILLMDEATAALDAATEEELRAAMETARQGRTTLIIAHRLATVRHLPRLLVLHGGRLVADGTHETLLEQCPAYRDLVRTQLIRPPHAHPVGVTAGED